MQRIACIGGEDRVRDAGSEIRIQSRDAGCIQRSRPQAC